MTNRRKVWWMMKCIRSEVIIYNIYTVSVKRAVKWERRGMIADIKSSCLGTVFEAYNPSNDSQPDSSWHMASSMNRMVVAHSIVKHCFSQSNFMNVHSLGWSLNSYINAGVIYSRFTSQLTPTNLLLPAPAPIMNPPGSSALSAMSLKL